jgi:hypothetical protein
MPSIYVATSEAFSEWASDVGLTRNVFKVGVTDEDPASVIEQLNAESHCGQTDWKLLKERDSGTVDEEAAIGRLRRKETLIDPLYYPRLKGAGGIFKLKPANVENHLLVKRTLAGQDAKPTKAKAADMANYLIENALS